MAGSSYAVGRVDEFAEGALRQVEVAGRTVLLARVEGAISAVSGQCTHYGAPLAEGVLHGRRVICPWHHAVYDVTTGAHLEPPGCNDLERYPVRVEDGVVHVELPDAAAGQAEPATAAAGAAEDRRVFVVVGAGAAGQAAAEMLRVRGFRGRVVMIGRENALPYDRTMLSKEVLQGAELPAPLDLRPAEFYERRAIELRLGVAVERLDAAARTLRLDDGTSLRYDACLLASGGRPRRLPVEGSDLAGVLTLRERADAERILEGSGGGRRVVVVGSSFIGLECAASLVGHGCAVTVVTPEPVPFAAIFGEAVGRALAKLHADKGVTMLLGHEVERFAGEGRVEAVVTKDGRRLPADLVVLGVGIAPATDFLDGIELGEDGGITVDASMRAAPGLWAAGDIARFPLPPTGKPTRIEHWRLAAEQGRVAARAMLGEPAARYEGAPFFWSAQHLALYYVGHAGSAGEVILDGVPGEGPFIAYYVEDGTVTAALGVERNREMAALQELFRLRALPDPARLRAGGFDAARHLAGL